MPDPQNNVFAGNPGEYRLAIRAPNSEINPGEDIVLEIYVTGYGTIRGPKVVFYPSIRSVASVSVGGWAVEAVQSMHRGMSHASAIFTLGVDDPFVNTGPTGSEVSAIKAEAGGVGAPVTLTLNTKAQWRYAPARTGIQGKLQVLGWRILGSLRFLKRRVLRKERWPYERRISPGVYSFQVFLTYFNGSVWKTDTQSASVTVRNLFQRYPYITWVLAVVALGPTLLWPIIRFYWDTLWDVLHASWYWLTQIL